MKKKYDSTVARIAGNLLSGEEMPPVSDNGWYQPYEDRRVAMAQSAVAMARAIVAEVERTEPEEPSVSPRTP